MTKKGKKRKKLRMPSTVQHIFRECDYYTKLNDAEKAWLDAFNDGTLNNNHRMYDIFTDHPDYDRIKKEIYGEVNARNRCIMVDSQVRKTLDSLDHICSTKEERYVSNLLFKHLSKKQKETILLNFGIKDIETSINSLISEVVDTVRNAGPEHDPKYTLIQFYIVINTLIKNEIKERRKQNSNA